MPDGTSKNLNINISGENSSAMAAINEVQAAIDGLHGKSFDVTANANTGRAAADLLNIGRAADGAASASARHAAESERAHRSTSEYGSAADRAAGSLRRFGDSTDSASRPLGAFSSDVDRVGRSMVGASSGVDRATSSMLGLGAGTDAVSRAVGGAGKSFESMWSSMESGSVGSAPSWAVGAAAGAAQVGASANQAGRFMADVGGETSRVSRDLVPFGTNADRAGGALERMGERGGRGMVELAKGSDGVFSAINAVGRVIPDLTDGVDGASGVLPDLGKGLGSVSRIAGPAGTALKVAGIGAGVSALGMGILGAATAGIGVGAGLGAIMSSGPLLNQAQKGLAGFTGEFRKASHAAADAGMPGMKALVGESKELGQTLAGIGVRHLPLALAEAGSLGSQLNGTLKQMEPAINPAIQAGGALGSALMTAVGNSTPYISEFSRVVESTAPALGREVESTARAATAVGGGALQLLAAAEPLFRGAANVAEAGTDAALGAVGIKSHYSGPKNPDGTQAPGGVDWNAIGNYIPNPMQAVDGAKALYRVATGGSFADSSTGGAAGDGMSGMPTHVPTQGGKAFDRQYPTAANPDMGETAKPGQATFSPGSRFGTSWDGSAADEPGGIPGRESLRPTDRAAEVSHGSFAKPVSPSNRTPDQNGIPILGTTEPGQFLAGRVGSSMGGGNFDNLRQQLGGVNSAMQQTTQTSQVLGSAGSSAFAQLGQAGQAGLGGVQQHAQQMPGALQQAQPQMQTAAQNLMSPLATAAQQAQPAQAVQAPMQAMAAQVTSQAPTMNAAGNDIGVAIGEGAGQGVVKEQTNTLTIVKKWVTNIIDTAASTLGIASPSKVFYGFGVNTVQGFQGGLQSAAPASVGAVTSMMSSSIGAAQTVMSGAGSQMFGGFSSQLQSGVQGAFAPLQGQMMDAAGNLLPAAQAAGQTGAQQFGPQAHPGAADAQTLSNANDIKLGRSGGKPLSEPQFERYEALKKANPNNPVFDDPRSAGLIGRTGMGAQSAADLLARQDEHNKRAGQLREGINLRHDAALGLSRNPELRGLGTEAQANAWRNSDQYNRTALGPTGQWDPSKSVAGANTPEKQTILGQVQAQQQAEAQSAAARAQGEITPGSASGTNLRGMFPLGSPAQAAMDGQQVGLARGEGTAQGIRASDAAIAKAARESADKHAQESKNGYGVNSPSKVFSDIGLDVGRGLVNGAGVGSAGLGGAVSSSLAGAQGVASDRGLMAGYSWATSMVDGVQSVMKKADFQNAGFPQIESELAKTELGALGLLGPAGSGASIYKTPMVSLPSSSSSSNTPTVIQNVHHIYLDGQKIREITDQQIVKAVDQLSSTIGRQVG